MAGHSTDVVIERRSPAGYLIALVDRDRLSWTVELTAPLLDFESKISFNFMLNYRIFFSNWMHLYFQLVFSENKVWLDPNWFGSEPGDVHVLTSTSE